MRNVFDLAEYTGAPPGGEAPKVRLLRGSELITTSRQQPWLVKHVIPSDAIGMLFGASGTFKSFVALDLALHVAHGRKWLGRRTVSGPVLYIAAEGGGGLGRRLQAWHDARNEELDADVPFHAVITGVPLLSDASSVVTAAAEVGVTPALVVVDTMSQTFGGEENSATEVAKYFRELGTWFRETWHCAVLIIHHVGHSATERPRGSSALESNVDFLFGVFRDESDMSCTLECRKQKDGERCAPLMFSLESVLLGEDDDGDEVRSLYARQITDGAKMIQLLDDSHKRGRPRSAMAQLLEVVQTGARYLDVRLAFDALQVDKQPDAKKRAWFRALGQAKALGLVEVVRGEFVVVADIHAKPQGDTNG